MRRSSALVGALALFLTLSLPAGPARAEAGAASQSASQAAPTKSPPATRPRRLGLFIGGLTTLGVGYALSAMAGIDSLSSYSGGTVCNTNTGACMGTGNPQGRDLLIPVAGPWLAFRDIRELPVLAFLGIAQATGVVLTLAGIVRYSRDGAEALGEASGVDRARSQPSSFISLGVLPTRDGAFGFLSGRM